MKRTLMVALVLGVLTGQAFAAPFILDVPTARQFTQLNTINVFNQLHLVIDAPGLGSPTYLDDGYFPTDYGTAYTPMLYNVGFAGHIQIGNTMLIGKSAGLAGFDSFGIDIANDNDDTYRYRAFVSYDNLASVTYGAPIDLVGGAHEGAPGPHTGFVSVGIDTRLAVTDFGFSLEIVSDDSDDFHTSVVPVPGAILLGFLGLGAAGLKLRRFA